MFPLIIHSPTIANWFLLIVTPNSGNTFWWRRAFHVIASLQNIYVRHTIPRQSGIQGSHTGDSLVLSYRGHSSRIPLGLSLRPCVLGIHLSTRQRTHHDTVGCPSDRNRVVFGPISGGKLGGRISCIEQSDTSSAAMALDYPTSIQQG